MSPTFRRNISKFLELQQHEKQSAEDRGESDSQNESFDINSTEMPGYMQETMSQAKGAWSAYETAHQEYAKELSTKIANEEYQVRSGIPDEIKNLEEKKRADDELFEGKQGRNSSEYKKIDEELAMAKSDYEKIRAELNRPLLIKFERVYLPFLAILAIAEVPINRQAFELFFSESPAVILVLALATGIMLVFFAHSIGHLLKENTGPENTGKMTGYTIGGMAAIASVTGILMYMLAVMRQSYADVSKGADETFGDLFSGDQSLEVFEESLFQTLSGEGISLLVLNFSIYFAGILASYFRHDPNSNYEKITKNHHSLRDKMAKKKEAIDEHLNKIQSVHNKSLQTINTRRKNLSEGVAALKDEVSTLQAQKTSDKKTVIANLNTLFKAYEKGFRKNIGNRKLPKFFSNTYNSKIKPALDD